MASLNSIFDSVGRATSTPRVNVNPSQGARSKLLSRSRQSTSPPVERVSESEREHINTQISDLEKALQDLTSDYQRCRAELEQTIRRRRHISFGNISDVTYQIQRDPKSPLKVVHVDQLKPYEGILPPKNWLPVDTLLDESIEPPEFSRLESSESFEPEDAEIDSASPDFTVPSAEPFRQSRWGRRIKPPVVYSP